MSKDIMSAETAKVEFAETIGRLKREVADRMKTRRGRDDIRRTFGCRIEGFAEEETSPPQGGLFNSPMS